MKAASKPLFNILLIAIVFHLSSLLTMSVIGAMFRSLDASTDLLFNELCAKNCLSHRWLRAFVRWDAIHFVSVASRGYLIEKNGAFFPLYPFVLKKISDVAYIFGSVECAVIRFTIGGVLISFVCKLLSIVLLYKISVNFCESKQKIAYISALFFIFNPANAFQCSL